MPSQSASAEVWPQDTAVGLGRGFHVLCSPGGNPARDASDSKREEGGKEKKLRGGRGYRKQIQRVQVAEGMGRLQGKEVVQGE